MAKDLLDSMLFGISSDPPADALSRILGLSPPPAPNPKSILDHLSSLVSLQNPLPPVIPQQGIRFGDSVFSEPNAFSIAWLPPTPGLYAILVFDCSCSPRMFRVLYFGKAGDLAVRVVSSHEKYDEWCRAAGGAGNLYVAHCQMTTSYEWERTSIEASLIRQYTPVCNTKLNPLFGFPVY
jgi:hypothetical protein